VSRSVQLSGVGHINGYIIFRHPKIEDCSYLKKRELSPRDLVFYSRANQLSGANYYEKLLLKKELFSLFHDTPIVRNVNGLIF
jgi:hypothetical protein